MNKREERRVTWKRDVTEYLYKVSAPGSVDRIDAFMAEHATFDRTVSAVRP